MTIWLISDTHLGHEKFLTFDDGQGNLIRPFSCVEEMDETIVKNWNDTVSDGDRIYHLGDVFFGDGWKHLSRLKGKKRLILGNHDNGKSEHLHQHFGKIGIWRMFPEFKCVLTHVPILIMKSDPEQAKYWFNIHGHLHQNPSPTLNHYNVSVEQTRYKPVALEDVVKNLGATK